MRTFRSPQTGWCAAVALLLACSDTTGPVERIEPGELVIAPRVANLPTGGVMKFTASIHAKAMAIQGVTWSTSDSKVARIGADGTLVAGQVGTTQVFAQLNGTRAAATVTVYAQHPTLPCSKSQGAAICLPREPTTPKRRPLP